MEEKKSDADKPQGKGGSRLVLIIVAIVIAAGAAGGGVWFMTRSAGSPASSAAKGEHDEHGGAPAGAKPGQVQYVALDPAFVVNLADDSEGRYLQVEVKLMSKDPAATELIEQHGPLIRNRLLLLFGQKKAEELRTRENKEKLQADALAEVRKVFSAEAGRGVVDAVYFTSFVMQ
jgi:flagellar FliL protein